MISKRMQGELSKTKVTKKASHGKHLEVVKSPDVQARRWGVIIEEKIQFLR